MSEDRIVALEAEVRELRGLLEQSLSSRGPSTAATLGTGVANEPDDRAIGDEPVTRRAALRTAGVLAAGAVAGGLGMVASATPAAATTATYTADASNPALSVVADAGQSAINATSMNTDSTSVIKVVSGNNGVDIRAGRIAVTALIVSPSTATQFCRGGRFEGNHGVYAEGFYNAFNAGGVGVAAKGEAGAIQLYSTNPPPSYRTSGVYQGTIDLDTNGDVWLCTATGTPGTWRKISGPSAAGAFHAIAPVRAYDSRKSGYTLNGVIAKTTTRTVSVADSHNTSTGALVTSNVVPVGATAVAANVTVTGTTGNCYFCVNPGGTTTLGASTINWFGSGQTLANGVILTLDANRQVTIVAGDSVNPASAHCIIDITGYWL